MNLQTDDELVSARIAGDDDDVLLVTEGGQAIRFRVADLRVASRTSGGVRGIRLHPRDRVVAMEVVSPGQHLLTLTQQGYGKLTPSTSYPRHQRGGQGVLTFRLTDKTGLVAAAIITVVRPDQELMMVSRNGVVIRLLVQQIARQSRLTQGVKVMNIDDEDAVASLGTIGGPTNEPEPEPSPEKGRKRR